MSIDPLSVHGHFKCERKAFDGLEHYYKPVEVKVLPKVDWGDLATMDEFEKLLQPRIDNAGRLASEWERSILLEALRMGVWRVWFVQTTIWGETRVDTYTKVFPPWEIKQALALAKGLGEHIVGINLKRWLLMPEEQFLRESGSSQNRDVMMEMRRVLGKRCQRKCR